MYKDFIIYLLSSTQLLKRFNRELIDLMKIHTLNKGDATKTDEYQQKLVSIMQLLKEQQDLKYKNNGVFCCEDIENKVNFLRLLEK